VLLSIVGQVLRRRNVAESIGDVSRMWQVSDLTQGQYKDVEIVQEPSFVGKASSQDTSHSAVVLAVIKQDPIKMAGRAALCGVGACVFGFLAFAAWDGGAWRPLVAGSAAIAALGVAVAVSYLRSAMVRPDALVFRTDGLVDRRGRASNVIPWARTSQVQLERDTVNNQTTAWRITFRVERDDRRVVATSLDAGGMEKDPETIYRMIVSALAGELGTQTLHGTQQGAELIESTGGDTSTAPCPHCGRLNSIHTRVCPRCERPIAGLESEGT